MKPAITDLVEHRSRPFANLEVKMSNIARTKGRSQWGSVPYSFLFLGLLCIKQQAITRKYAGSCLAGLHVFNSLPDTSEC